MDLYLGGYMRDTSRRLHVPGLHLSLAEYLSSVMLASPPLKALMRLAAADRATQYAARSSANSESSVAQRRWRRSSETADRTFPGSESTFW
eukprot:788324-Heterocapsa_arctica.AAC.1